MMLDVYKITSTLERLDDASLQRYAAMHKQDPYVLSLAVEESNRRKRMRAAPQQAAQPQPPVNEQAVQAMAPAPEMSGLAQLPAAQMEMADGGIVAFADAGEVTGVLTPWSLIEQRIRAGDPKAIEYTRNYLQRPYSFGRGTAPDSILRLMESLPEPLPAPTAPVTEARKADTYGDTPARVVSPATASRPDAGLGALQRATTSSSARMATSGAAPSAAAPTDTIADTQKRYQQAIAGAGEATDPSAERREQNRVAAQEELAKVEAESEAMRPKGRPMEGLRTRLEKEESEVGAKREENLKMALINAGLAMMAGTSPYAMANIGAGGAQGVKAYREGIKDLEKAAERRQELFAKIEQADRAEQEGRADRALKLRSELAQLNRAYRASAEAGLEKAYGFKREDARAVFSATEQATRDRERIAAQERIAARQEAGASARSAAAIKAGEAREDAAQLRARVSLLSARLSEIQRGLSEIGPLGAKGPRAADYAQLITERDRITKAMDKLTKELAGEKVDSAAPDPAAPPPRMRFDAKGNPI